MACDSGLEVSVSDSSVFARVHVVLGHHWSSFFAAWPTCQLYHKSAPFPSPLLSLIQAAPCVSGLLHGLLAGLHVCLTSHSLTKYQVSMEQPEDYLKAEARSGCSFTYKNITQMH